MLLLTFTCWFFSSSACCRLFLLANSKLSTLFWHPLFHGKLPDQVLSSQDGCCSLMWLARLIPFPDGERCNQTSHSIWTFSTCCSNKDSIFAFRSSFTPIWETSRLSFSFFSEVSLCFISHFNSLHFHASLYFNFRLLWFMRPSPLFASSHLNKAK